MSFITEEGEAHQHRLQRYHALVEQQFLSGLTSEEQQEIERLGTEIDAVNSAFTTSLDSLAETIRNKTRGLSPLDDTGNCLPF